MKKAYLIIIVILALALSACGSTSTPTPIPTLVLDGNTSNDIAKPVSSVGNVVASAVLVPAREANLAFVGGGNIAKVNVVVGERVKAGQVLVELDNTLLQLEVEKAERNLREMTSPAAIAAAEEVLANAQETYDDAKKKVDSLKNRHADNVTIDYLEAQVTLAQDALDRARDAYKQTGRLSEVAPARAKATTNLYNAQKAYNNALANLDWYTELPSENEVALTNAKLDSATAALQEAKWYLSELKGESIPADATGAQLAQLQQARDNLQAAQARLDNTRLISPISGVITLVNAIAGEYVPPAQVMVIVSDIDHLQVETTDLSERYITQVKIGDTAKILVEAVNQEFGGKIINILPVANTLGGDVVYKVTIAFDEQPEGLLGGMTAEVTIGN